MTRSWERSTPKSRRRFTPSLFGDDERVSDFDFSG
jgi:hypothetical protein